MKVGALLTNSCQNIKYGYPAKYFIILMKKKKKVHPKCGGFLKEIFFFRQIFLFLYSFYFIKFEKYLDIFFWKFSLKINPTLIMEHTEEESSGY